MSKNSAKTIVLASNNPGKLAEFQTLFDQTEWTIVPQSDFDIESAEENGLSFVENAILKARHASRCAGLPAIADDSGLEVDALQGRPGIYSARFAGETADDNANNDYLLSQLAGVAENERQARFQCLLVYMQHELDPTPIISQGTWEGRVLESRSGKQGFGYDPLFYVPETQCSAAELTRTEKSRLSHRGKAMADLFTKLNHPPR